MNLRLTLAAATIACLTLAPTYAAEPVDTYTELAKCSGVADSTQRLACYDALAPRIRAALANGAAELSREDQTTLFGLNLSGIFGSSEATTPQQFGASDLPAPPPREGTPGASIQPINSITAKLTDFALTPTGKFIVFLDNGQVWRQQDSDAATAHFRHTPGDNTVVIEKGSLGSFQLSLNGGNKLYRVNRVK